MVATGLVEAREAETGGRGEDQERGEGEDRGRAVKVKLIAQEILSLGEAVAKRARTITLKLPRTRLDGEALALLKGLGRDFPGPASAFLHLDGPDGVAVDRLRQGLRPRLDLVNRLRGSLGPAGLELR